MRLESALSDSPLFTRVQRHEQQALSFQSFGPPFSALSRITPQLPCRHYTWYSDRQKKRGEQKWKGTEKSDFLQIPANFIISGREEVSSFLVLKFTRALRSKTKTK